MKKGLGLLAAAVNRSSGSACAQKDTIVLILISVCVVMPQQPMAVAKLEEANCVKPLNDKEVAVLYSQQELMSLIVRGAGCGGAQ
jgi:hypothetical protein